MTSTPAAKAAKTSTTAPKTEAARDTAKEISKAAAQKAAVLQRRMDLAKQVMDYAKANKSDTGWAKVVSDWTLDDIATEIRTRTVLVGALRQMAYKVNAQDFRKTGKFEVIKS